MRWPVVLVLMFYAAVAACSLFILVTSTLVDRPPVTKGHKL